MAATHMTTKFTCSECDGDLRVGLPKVSGGQSINFQVSIGPCKKCMSELDRVKTALKNIMDYKD